MERRYSLRKTCMLILRKWQPLLFQVVSSPYFFVIGFAMKAWFLWFNVLIISWWVRSINCLLCNLVRSFASSETVGLGELPLSFSKSSGLRRCPLGLSFQGTLRNLVVVILLPLLGLTSWAMNSMKALSVIVWILEAIAGIVKISENFGVTAFLASRLNSVRFSMLIFASPPWGTGERSHPSLKV